MLGFKIVRQNHVGLIETLGRYSREVSAGLNLYIPVFQKVRIVNLAMIPLSLKGYSVITKDNAEVQTNVTLNYHVTNAKKFEYEISETFVVGPETNTDETNSITTIASTMYIPAV